MLIIFLLTLQFTAGVSAILSPVCLRIYCWYLGEPWRGLDVPWRCTSHTLNGNVLGRFTAIVTSEWLPVADQFPPTFRSESYSLFL